MIRYSLKKILKKAGTSSKRILLAFKAHASSRMPRNRFDPIYAYSQMDFSGESYMLNPHELIEYSFKWKPKEVAQYIGLASYRNYSEYILNNDKTLDLFHSPVDQDTINNNSLLRIHNGRIHFYYEEDLKRRKQLWQD